jgi:phage-related protein
MHYFHTIFLDDAVRFIAELDAKTAKKVLYNVDLAEQTNDPKLFKKLQNEIWEFRTNYGGLQIRVLAFWDKTGSKETLVIAALGFIKKGDKVPRNEIERAAKIRMNYFKNK